eukprot:m.167344 g.167344  ORF g.167344 m.167344 type:complete len:504 (+) comp17193_c0_seq5:38-1549(+)
MASKKEKLEKMQEVQTLVSENMETPVRVNKVQVIGAKRTKAWLLAKHSETVLRAQTLGEALYLTREAAADLKQLGIFRRVEAALDANAPTDKGERIELNIALEVDEKRLLSGQTGIKVGSSNGAIDMKLDFNNLLGLADKLELKSQRFYGGRTVLDAAYSLPVGGDVYYPLTLSTFQVHQAQTASSHDQLIRGVAVDYQTYSVLGQHNVRYEWAWRNVANVADRAAFSVRNQAGHSVKSALVHTLLMEFGGDSNSKSSSSSNGSEGSTDGSSSSSRQAPAGTATSRLLQQTNCSVKVENEVAGLGPLGGSAQFVKNAVQVAVNTPVASSIVHLGLQGGLLVPFEWSPSVQEGVPAGAVRAVPAVSNICDRFWLGGAHDVRGFNHNGLGPLERSDALGGDAYWAAGLSVFLPFPHAGLRTRFQDALRVHAFTNAGSLCALDTASSTPVRDTLSRLSRYSVSAGIGLCFRAPQWQAELNFCVPVRALPTDRVQRGLQFGIGFTFL